MASRWKRLSQGLRRTRLAADEACYCAHIKLKGHLGCSSQLWKIQRVGLKETKLKMWGIKRREERKRKGYERQSKVSDEDRLDGSGTIETHRIGGQPGSDTPGTTIGRNICRFVGMSLLDYKMIGDLSLTVDCRWYNRVQRGVRWHGEKSTDAGSSDPSKKITANLWSRFSK